MRKRSASSPPKDVTRVPPATIIKQKRVYQLITPLYGGGVSPALPDPITVVRTTEARGQLRFWWRAYHAAKFSDLAALKNAEDELWGAAATKEEKPKQENEQHQAEQDHKRPQTTVQMEIKVNQPGKDIAAYRVIRTQGQRYRVNEQRPVPLYAVFPLQPAQEKLDAWDPAIDTEKHVREGVVFTLTLFFPEEKKEEVAAALWAWETFGGIGARTRRGFGALRLLSIDGKEHTDLPDLKTQTPEKWIQEKLKKLVAVGRYPLGMPRLTSTLQFVVTSPEQDSYTIWNKLIQQLRRFRQHRQNSDVRNPGRSLWPEPSEIRKFTNQGLPAHKTPPIPDPPIHKFPRAIFGLPIIFHFIKNDPYNPDKEPRNTILRLDISERLASPLILKPLACLDGRYVGLAVILDGTGIEQNRLILKTQDKTPKEGHVKYIFDSSESLVLGQNSSHKPVKIDSSTNALQAFLQYLEGM